MGCINTSPKVIDEISIYLEDLGTNLLQKAVKGFDFCTKSSFNGELQVNCIDEP